MDQAVNFWTSLGGNQLAVTLVLLAIPILPNLWSIWHAFHRDFPTVQEKMAWVMACTFVPVLGGIAYILIGRRRSRPMAPYTANTPGGREPQSPKKDDA